MTLTIESTRTFEVDAAGRPARQFRSVEVESDLDERPLLTAEERATIERGVAALRRLQDVHYFEYARLTQIAPHSLRRPRRAMSAAERAWREYQRATGLPVRR